MLAIDGNFHLQRNQKGIGKDFPLTGNGGFWADDGELEDYIEGKGAKVEQHERNWKKLCGEGAYYVALQTLDVKTAELSSIEESIGQSRLESLVEEAARQGNAQYSAQLAKGPSRASTLIRLKRSEESDALSRMELDDEPSLLWTEAEKSEALFLSNAIELEDLQYQLRSRNLDDYIVEGTGGAEKRRAQHLRSLDALRRRCDQHLSALSAVCPGISQDSVTRLQDPTVQDLHLPSSYTEAQRMAFGIVGIAHKEAQLRVGNAHDNLNALKDALGLRSLLVQAKKTHVRGQVQNTRSEASIKRASQVVLRHKHAYQRDWKAIVSLGVEMGATGPAAGLQELRDNDIRNLREFIDNREYGRSADSLPWIWRSVGNALPLGASISDAQRAVKDWEQEGRLEIAGGKSV
ncbi:hypothetical protein FRB90_007155 [Tulasnella sp. 427]|nr:hypothetical protein FRB90_007155 [Tulasnella sp. 427]